MNLPLDGISVLAVDDDRGTLEALTLVLESRGARVYPAESATVALALRNSAVALDIIVSDVTMAGTDGLAMMIAMRAAEAALHRAPTPAIAVSGHATPQDRMRALGAGYQLHVAKPISVERLVSAIGTLVGREAGGTGGRIG